jgi:hypothetical protein
MYFDLETILPSSNDHILLGEMKNFALSMFNKDLADKGIKRLAFEGCGEVRRRCGQSSTATDYHITIPGHSLKG